MNTMMESQQPESGKSNEVSGKSKSVPRIKYADESKTDPRLDLSVLLKRRLFYLEQWSPTNPQGKRQYDSNFLLQFQRHPVSLSKPSDLPNIDCVLDEPHNKFATPMQPMESRPGGSDFIPNFLRGSSPRRGPRRQNPQDSRSVHTPMSGHGSKVNTDSDMKLNTTVNAWRPTRQDTNLIVSQDEEETIEIMRSIGAIMNELTPSTFKSLMQQVLSLNIDTERKLRGVIDLIFEKAVEEPNFSEAYANMCRQMTTIQVTPEENRDQHTPIGQVEFRKLLLTKCQREFEKIMSDQEHLLELQKRMDTDAELAPQLKEEYETAKCRMCRRMIGNIRFIGELFKLKMLTESIMHNCIMSLFKAKDDDHLEPLCLLLTTIGKDLDHVKGKQRMDQYFDQIRKTIQEKRTSARVRFMLQNVGELRSNNWVPHAIQTQGPKTISQIHQDAEQEQEMLQLKLATTPTAAPMKQGNRGQDRMRSRGHGEDGWTKVPSPPKPTRFDPNRMKLMKPSNIEESKATLGPSRGFGGWKSGSARSGITRTGLSEYSLSGSIDKIQESEEQSNTPTSMMNRFSALSQGAQGSDYDYQRRHDGRQGSREGSRTRSRGSKGPPSTSSSGGHTPRRDDRTLLPQTFKASKPSKANEQYCLEMELTKLLDNACTNEEIFEWVDKNLKGEDLPGPAFLRALTLCICKRSIATDATVIVNEDKISERSILLKRYVDTEPERELQVLYALQHLMVDLEQPANVLRWFFDVFYDEDIVQEQSFYKWEESEDPNEQEGKVIAIASVNPFFTWLRTAEAESD